VGWSSSRSSFPANQDTNHGTNRSCHEIGVAAALQPSQPRYPWQSCPWDGLVAALRLSQPRYQQSELSMGSVWQQLCNPANHGTPGRPLAELSVGWPSSRSSSQPTMVPTVGAVNGIGVAAALQPSQPRYPWQSCPWDGLVALFVSANHGTNSRSCQWNRCGSSSATQPTAVPLAELSVGWSTSRSSSQPTTVPTVGAVNGIGVAAALQPSRPPYLRQSCPWDGLVALFVSANHGTNSRSCQWRSVWQQLCNPANHGTIWQSCPWDGVVAALRLSQPRYQRSELSMGSAWQQL
jgi:hypothetical protein